MAAIALANIEIMRRERIVENVAANEAAFRATLAPLLDLPIAGDLRGAGYFYAIELVKDKETPRDVHARREREARATFTPAVRRSLLRGFLSEPLLRARA